MKKFSVKTIVAIGIGAALFFVLGRFVAIPSPVPNTNISTQYGLLGFMAALFGPVAGLLIGLIGHALIDFSYGGSFGGIWWSWVIASAVCGFIMGLGMKKLALDDANQKYVLQSCNPDKESFPDIIVDELLVQGIVVGVYHRIES